MTFSIKVKEEVSKLNLDNLEYQIIACSYLNYAGKILKNKISVTIENASVARFIYKMIKEVYGISIKIIIRNQKRFRIKQIYILEIYEKIKIITADIKNLFNHLMIDSKEEASAFLKGTFLSCGNISDPKISGYHLEFSIKNRNKTYYLQNVLNNYNINSKVLKRENSYMIYIKEAEKISDFLKLIEAINSFFYYEDIRIYKDHKNMVNRLNNCEIANQEKIIKNGVKQLNDINFLKENDLLDLLDEKTLVIIKYREKYPETSYNELAEIISLETGMKITKSLVNHHFIKVRKLIEKFKNKE